MTERYKPSILANRIVLLALCLFVGCGFGSATSHLDMAERFRAEGKFREAIGEYEQHIQDKLKIAPEPTTVIAVPAEKVSPEPSPDGIGSVTEAAVLKQSAVPPYFFSLMIGDLYLKLDDPDQAKASYLKARDNSVDPSLVAHKIRYLGHWYEEHGKIEEAMAIYTDFNELDPLLFDMDKDRLYKFKLELRNREREEREPKDKD